MAHNYISEYTHIVKLQFNLSLHLPNYMPHTVSSVSHLFIVIKVAKPYKCSDSLFFCEPKRI